MTVSRSVTGENVRGLLRERSLSQGALADALGITAPAVSQKLAGLRSITDSEIAAIAEFLGVDPGALFAKVGA